jgi:hypothetical protein
MGFGRGAGAGGGAEGRVGRLAKTDPHTPESDIGKGEASFEAAASMAGMLKGFGRRPFAGARGLGAGPASESLVRRKARVGKGVVWLARRDLWGFWGRGQSAGRASEGGGAHCSGRERRGRAFSRSRMRAAGVSAAPGESLGRSYGHRLPGLARGWRRGGTALRGGKRGDGHEVSTLIRVGDGERAGRAPWNVSTMIIRPPQHGH